MKTAELEKKLTFLEERINAFGDIGTKISEIEGYMNRARDGANETDRLISEISTKRTEIEQQKVLIDEVVVSASTRQGELDGQKSESTKLLDQLKTATKEVAEINKEAKNQLGSISAEVLSTSFKGVAEELEDNSKWWRKIIFGSIGVLTTAGALIVYWELKDGGQISFFNSNFLLKITLTSPLVFLVVFATRQYSREKKLQDEYKFKSAVSLSFEAFRKMIKQEDSRGDHAAIVQFMIDSITSIYSSPMDNILRHSHKDEDVNEVNMLSGGDVLQGSTAKR